MSCLRNLIPNLLPLESSTTTGHIVGSKLCLFNRDVRQTKKQAGNEHRAKKEKLRIYGHILLKEANKFKSDINHGSVSFDNLAKMKEHLLDNKKKIRSKLSSSEELMPLDVADALEDVLVNV